MERIKRRKILNFDTITLKKDSFKNFNDSKLKRSKFILYKNKLYNLASKHFNRKNELTTSQSAYEYNDLKNIVSFKDFKTKVKQHLSSNIDTSSYHSVLMIEIDNYQSIVTTYSKSFASALLISFANILDMCLTKSDIISYISDGRFCAYVDDVSSIAYTSELSKRIKELFLEEVNYGEFTCSIGYYTTKDVSLTFTSMCDNAYIALCFSKLQGRGYINGYEESYRLVVNTDKHTLNSLKEDDFFPVSKPFSSINESIVFNIIDILSNNKDFDRTFYMSLVIIGNYYSLDNISIYELGKNDNYYELSYCFNSKKFKAVNKVLKKFEKSELGTLISNQDSMESFYSCNDINTTTIQSSSFKEFAKETKIKCFYTCNINDKSGFSGQIFASSLSGRSDWSFSSFTNSITLVSKMIGSHLARYRFWQDKDKLTKIDGLTKAFNLNTFIDNVSSILIANPTNKYAMIYLDINKFKIINETYGYETGDYILLNMASIMQSIIEEGKETYGRVADDKFVVFLEYLTSEKLKKRMTKFINELKVIKKQPSDNYNITIIAGIMLINNYDDDNISTFIDKANIARRSIKSRSESSYAFFNESMKQTLMNQKRFEDMMYPALNNNEFCLYFQPKYSLKTDTICGAEALVRWLSPTQGLIPPDKFIPAFEKNSFIIQIDYFIFDKVCQFIRNLLDKGLKPVPISVNFSRIHLNNTKILSKLKQTIQKYDLSPKYIEIEITECALSESNSFANSILLAIKRQGFKLAMDDFGSGFSSLNTLRKQPFDILKLDKDFFQKDNITDKEKIIISNIVRLGKELDMEIVAEGVETIEQNNFLKEIKCPVVQGYVYSKPMPEEDFRLKYFS